MKTVVLVSGGLDSYIAYKRAEDMGFRPTALWVDLGQPYATKEETAIDNFDFKVEKVGCGIIGPRMHPEPTPENQEIHGRNLLLTTIAACIGAERIWLSALRGEMHGDISCRDKSHEFLQLASGLMSYTFKSSRKKVVVETPFEHWSKWRLVRYAISGLGLGNLDFHKTVTCYHPDHTRCGNCSACFKRWVAMYLNDIEEAHSQNVAASSATRDEMQKILTAVRKYDFSHYNRNRCQEALSAALRYGEPLWNKETELAYNILRRTAA